MNFKRLSEFGLSVVLSLSSLLVIAVPKAYAATLSWDGEGSDENFSTAANWSGDVVPQDGDILTFDPAVTGSGALNNDLSNISLAGINILPGTSGQVRIAGNGITITGNIDVDHAFMLETDLALGGAIGIDVASSVGSLFTGVISGAGNITKTGSGYMEFEGNNTYTGNLIINAGSFYAIGPNAFGSSSGSTTINDGGNDTGTICYAFGTSNTSTTLNEPFVFNKGSISGYSGDIAIFSAVPGCGRGGAGGATSEVTTLAGSITIAQNTLLDTIGKIKITGTINGNFTIKLPAGSQGVLELPSGIVPTEKVTKTVEATDINSSQAEFVYGNNILVVNGERGQVEVFSGGVLKGTGKVGILNIEAGGILAPGLSPGCLASGNLTLAGTYEVEIGGATECSGYDRTNVTGTVDVTGGTLQIVKFNNFTPAAGQVFQIIANDGNDAITGTFQNLAEGATATFDGVVYRVSYVGGDGNDVTLTVVSVPATPETGFQLLANNPLATLAGTMLAASAILMIAKKYNRVSTRE